MEKEKTVKVKSIHAEEEIVDEFDMTEIAKNMGCYTPAPKQQKQCLDANDVQGIVDGVLDEMDGEDLTGLTDEEVRKEFDERVAKKRQEEQKKLNEENGHIKAKAPKGDNRYLASDDVEINALRTAKLKGKDLHCLKIERDCPRNIVLDTLRAMCLEVEAITKCKKVSDFSEFPCFLSVKDWNNDIQELSDDEYWEIDLKEPYDLTEETKGQIDDDLYPLINQAVHCFSFYRKKSNFTEEDGIWLEKSEDGEWQPTFTYAASVNKAIREVMPENVDKLFGFNIMNMFSKKSMEAMKKREATFNEGERKTVDSFIKSLQKHLSNVKPEDLIKDVKKSLCDVPKIIWNTVGLDIDEDERHQMMFIAYMMNKCSETFANMEITKLVKTKSDDKDVDEGFKAFFETFNIGKMVKKANKNDQNKI